MRYNYTNALRSLMEWAETEGYEKITLNHTDISQIGWKSSTLNQPNAIKIEGRYPIEIKVYLMLHELGHHQLRKDWVVFEKKLPVTAHAEHIHYMKKEGKYKRRTTYKVACMEEEFKAWEEGLKLAKRFEIKINEKKWNELKARCLISYIRYYGTQK